MSSPGSPHARYRNCKRKKTYVSELMASLAAREYNAWHKIAVGTETRRAYRCDWCWLWHIGRAPKPRVQCKLCGMQHYAKKRKNFAKYCLNAKQVFRTRHKLLRLLRWRIFNLRRANGEVLPEPPSTHMPRSPKLRARV